MTKVHSHYDNLKVSRDAPPNVIKAAYGTLSQQYHPDRCTLPDAERIMSILNKSYEVLSDPVRRAVHDTWLDEQEVVPGSPSTAAEPQTQAERASRAPRKASSAPRPAQAQALQRYMFWPLVASAVRGMPWSGWFFIIVMSALYLYSERPKQVAGGWEDVPRAAAPSQPPQPAYQRPAVAPNGTPWPVEAEYLDGYTAGYSSGYSTVTVDNSSNAFDVYVKLLPTEAPTGTAARHVYIPAHRSFTLRDISIGNYELRYINLATGDAFKSKPISLTEQAMPGGIQYSEITMTLYTVHNGNARMQPISADQF